jgi:hypothetical protein
MPPPVHLVDVDEGKGEEVIATVDMAVAGGKMEGSPAVRV